MKDYDSANKYIKEYCKEYPYVKESVNIILNTLLIESKRTTSSLVEENSLIKLVCCEALSDITNNSLDKLDYLDTKNFNNYSGIYLYNRILDGIYLHNVNLSYAYLRHTSFKDATITKSNLDNSNLHHANFTGANLNNTRLVQCNLKKANFTGANLIWAELEYSNLVEANFSNVVADNCNFQCCLIDERTYNNYIASISTDFEIINPKDYLLIDDLYKQYAEFNLHRRNDVKLMHYKDKKKYIRKYIDF
ncbi:MAG TPA: hypothetical protein DDX14_06065 [Cyanobacteria bacterium UBA9579]|nr:hypothetical protein [Cyanobacteria bacterium UBA9579]